MRDPTVLVWPDTLFRPAGASATIDRPLFKGPKPLSGREQVVAADGGGWLISYTGIAVYGSNYSAWRSLWLKVAAMGLPVYVAPDLITAIPAATSTEFSDLEAFSDGASFAQRTGDCSLSAAAVRGTRTISVTNSSARPRSAGDWFELDGRAHIIQEINGTTWTIWPSLRDNYASGTVLEIDDPRVKVYLLPDSKGNTMNTDSRQLTMMSLEFIEAGW
jgi:hypothetical protein